MPQTVCAGSSQNTLLHQQSNSSKLRLLMAITVPLLTGALQTDCSSGRLKNFSGSLTTSWVCSPSTNSPLMICPSPLRTCVSLFPLSMKRKLPVRLLALQVCILLRSRCCPATQAKALLSQSFESGQKLQGLVSQHATEAPPSNDGLDTLISELIQKHPKEAERLRQGQNKLLAFFIGQAMRASKGRADVKILGPLIQQKIRG